MPLLTVNGLRRSFGEVEVLSGLTAAVYRTVTRPPLNHSGPLVPTPFGDLR